MDAIASPIEVVLETIGRFAFSRRTPEYLHVASGETSFKAWSFSHIRPLT